MNLGLEAFQSSGVVSSNPSNGADLINIQNVDDSFARYKMPKLFIRTKLKGQFADTYVSNLKDIAKALKTELKALVRFISSDINSPLKEEPDHYVIKGAFTYDQLLNSLRKFINKYILCPSCNLPELDYSEVKGKIHYKCRSCGYHAELASSDKISRLLITSKCCSSSLSRF